MTIKTNISEVIKGLSDFEKIQIPYATSVALNNTMFGATKDLTETLLNKFDNPSVPYFKNSKGNPRAFYIKKSNKKNLTVSMGLREDGPGKGSYYDKVLGHHFVGGSRQEKRFEKALKSIGLGSRRVIIGDDAPNKNRYGNLTGGFYQQLMSYFQMHKEVGYSMNMTLKRKSKIEKKKKKSFGRGKNKREYMTYAGKKYFIATGYPGTHTAHLKPGIYSATGIHGSNVTPILVFTKSDSTNYTKQIDFNKEVENYFNKNFNKNFNKAIQNAINTPK